MTAKKKTKVVVCAKVAAAKVGGGLTTEEVIGIIGACSRANVSSFSFGGLSLTFEKRLDDLIPGDPQEDTPPEADRPPLVAPRPTQARPKTPTRQELEEARQRLADVKVAQEEAKAQELIDERQRALEQLRIEDPEAYEMAELNGEI